MRQRLGACGSAFWASEYTMLTLYSNLARAYQRVERFDESLRMRRDVYSGFSKLYGEQHGDTLTVASNLANLLVDLGRIEEAKALLRKTTPVARRVLGDGHDITLKLRRAYAMALYRADGATLDDIREAVTTLEDAEQIARRVLGGAHPVVAGGFEASLQEARAVLRARAA